jgi:hypothetical protein|tara:strand:+ start:701 stop:943 length:243 start_codon:yes stop_codon:yes gene_type:complete
MKAKLEYDLPEDQEQFNVAIKGMDWALLVWDINKMIGELLKYGVPVMTSPIEEQTAEQVLEHLRNELLDIMESKGLQFPT